MTIYSDPPDYRSFSSDKPTLLVCWWCTAFSATTILFRVTGRYIRTEKLFPEDWLAFACLIPLIIRMVLVQLIFIYGTNNTVTDGMSDFELSQREIGSRLVLASRIFYAATLWMLKLTISEFFKRLTLHIWKRSYEIMLRCIRWFLLVTFIGIVISDISECQPITHYWQVSPDPGPRCRQGYAQLLTMGISNVMTDLLLVFFPIPIIILSQMTVKRKIQLVLLFSLSVFPVAITCYRIPNIISRGGSQQYRSLWASIEILFATAVANALVLGSFVRDRGLKKVKWKFGSMSDSVERTTSRRGTAIRDWGSDEDLVRDLGMTLDPELRGAQNTGVPRVAPMADRHATPVMMGANANWEFPAPRGEGDGESEESDLTKDNVLEPTQSPSHVSIMSSPRRVAFFDVSNLLGDESPSPQPTRHHSIAADSSSLGHTQNPMFEPPAMPQQRKGSMALLQDVGGLLSSPTSRPPRTRTLGNSSRVGGGGGIELQTIPQNRKLERQTTAQSLQDVGGLLK